ncbi:MAG: Fe-S cluster assembly protein SufD [Alphaproteobacteria bacterium]|nr:Fe-S cluster assembly protein SufD [Alphaproteobacteria bacterium]
MSQKINPVENFVSGFEAIRATLAGNDLPWLDSLRRSGIGQFEDIGLPGPKVESWKYTRLRPLEDTTFRPVTLADREAYIDQVPTVLPSGSGCPRIVFVNGFMRSDLSCLDNLTEGVTVESLGAAVARDPDWVEAHLGRIGRLEGQPLVALNTAMMNSGVVVHVRRGVVVEQPIQMIFIAGLTEEPVACYPRNLIVMEEASQATLVKLHAGLGVSAYLANAVTEVDVGDAAILRHYRVQSENMQATHLGSLHVRIGRDATYDGFGLHIGGRLSRTEVFARLEGEGGHCALNGAYLMKGREHCDNTTVIEHAVPHTTCSEVFKGILDDESRGVFQGRIVVHKDAQGTDGHQLSNVLLLSDKAEMDAKPELEIYADDVKCSHGATTGQLDETALFYLRSRGIPEALARNLLIQSFVAGALDEIKCDAVREAMMSKVVHWLPAKCFLAEEWTEE